MVVFLQILIVLLLLYIAYKIERIDRQARMTRLFSGWTEKQKDEYSKERIEPLEE